MSVIQSEFGFLGVSISAQASLAGVLVEYKVYVNCLKSPVCSNSMCLYDLPFQDGWVLMSLF